MPSQAESEALSRYWRGQLEAWQKSGQSQQAYCKANDLNYHRFGYWKRKFRERTEAARTHQRTGFVPATYASQTPCNGLTLAFPNGLILQGITTDNLSAVDQLLRRLS